MVSRSPQVTAGLVANALAVSELQIRNTGVRETVGLRRVLRDHQAHAIMADTPRDLRLSVLATRWPRRAVVYRYNLNYRSPRHHLGDRLYALGISATVYLSEFIERQAEPGGRRFGSGRSYRIPNGFDTDMFAPDPEAGAAFRARIGVNAEEAVVLTAGKLVPGKRLERGVEALGRLKAGGRGLTYVLCGEGPEEARLRALAHDLGLRIRFTGMLDQAALRGAYNAADLVLHTARETFGNVVGEAMACARPVACVREGAAPEVIGDDGRAGILLPADDTQAIASAVADLLADPARRDMIGHAARSRIERVFPLQRMISGYEEMFRNTVAGG
jgi:glycosyltransferase involved in cell wall biosynthesis